MQPKINIIISCGLLSLTDPIEIDRYKRFILCLEYNSKIEIPDNINLIFAEFGEEPRLRDVISKYYNGKHKYLFYSSKDKFDQVELWKASLLTWTDFDFAGFLHSDIVLTNNFYNVLNKRLNNENTNYYGTRFHLYNNLNKLNLNKIKFDWIECNDYGFKYILDINNKGDWYSDRMKISYYDSNIPGIIQNPSQIPSAFICLSKKSLYKINLDRIISYHNDVMIRDFSIMEGINFEWINDEIIFLHLNGKDDELKTLSADYEMTKKIIKKYSELSYYGFFRFRNDFIPYIQNIDKKFIFNNYIKNKMQYSKELENYINL